MMLLSKRLEDNFSEPEFWFDKLDTWDKFTADLAAYERLFDKQKTRMMGHNGRSGQIIATSAHSSRG